MKINEFIEKVNEHDGMKASKTDEGIAVGIPPKLSLSVHGLNIYCIPEDATNFIEIDTWATSNSLYWKKPDREYLSELIEELLHTPVKERFPEKKYRLRWLDSNEVPTKSRINPNTYLGIERNELGGFCWATQGIDIANIFTEKELQHLKINNPKLAPAIEAMKEPVEEE